MDSPVTATCCRIASEPSSGVTTRFKRVLVFGRMDRYAGHMNAQAQPPESWARIYPDHWLGPMDLSRHFDPEKPLTVDMGCGKGRFLLAKAAHEPDTQFLGVERMLVRVRKVCRKIERRQLHNARLIRVEGEYATRYLLPDQSVDTFFLFFPDPWPKKRHMEHRLFDDSYRDALIRILKPGAAVHVATDHQPYVQQIKALMDDDRRFEPIPPYIPDETERTDFECLFLGRKPIGRCAYMKSV